MQLPACTLVALSLCTLCLFDQSSESEAAPSLRQRRSTYDQELLVAVLEELLQDIKHENAQLAKRRVDAGYGSRYGVASSVGSKLMALKQAADWNGPGRKRRGVSEEDEEEQ